MFDNRDLSLNNFRGRQIDDSQTAMQLLGSRHRLQSGCMYGVRKATKYTKSLVNTNSFYKNFTNRHFQKVPIPHLTRTMKQKFLHPEPKVALTKELVYLELQK